jgi:hypothetical protein
VAGGRHARARGVSEWSSWSLSVYATHAARTASMPRGLQVAFLERSVSCGRDAVAVLRAADRLAAWFRCGLGAAGEGWEDKVSWGLGWVEDSLHASSFGRSPAGLTSVKVPRPIRGIPLARVRAGRNAVRPFSRHSVSHASSPFGAACTRVAHFTQSMHCGSGFTLSAHGQHRACPDDDAWAHEGDAEIQRLRWCSCGVRP